MANNGPYERDEKGQFAPAGGGNSTGVVRTGVNTHVATFGDSRALYHNDAIVAEYSGETRTVYRLGKGAKGDKAEQDRFSQALKPKSEYKVRQDDLHRPYALKDAEALVRMVKYGSGNPKISGCK